MDGDLNPPRAPMLPSVFDLVRYAAHLRLVESNLVDMVQRGMGGVDALRVVRERQEAIADLALSMPATSVPDAIAHITLIWRNAAALDVADGDMTDGERQKLTRQLVRGLIGAVPILTVHAGIELATLGALEIPEDYEGTFGPIDGGRAAEGQS